MKIIDNIYRVPGVTANSYILIDADGLTIIDTGLPHSDKKCLEYIASLGRSARDIKRILITHADLDHFGSLAALHGKSEACTYASEVEAEAIALGRSSRPINRTGNSFQRYLITTMIRLLKVSPFRVDEILTDGQILPVMDGLQVVETPGHSPQHLSFYVPSVGVLFCGDSMRSDKGSLRASRSRNNWDQSLVGGSVRKQAALGARIVCPGHGPVVREANLKFPI